MLHIGCHLSASKGYFAMGKTALSIGADTFQFFTRNPRGSRAKELDLADAEKLNTLVRENNFALLLAHAPYTINPCSANPEPPQEALLDAFAVTAEVFAVVAVIVN